MHLTPGSCRSCWETLNPSESVGCLGSDRAIVFGTTRPKVKENKRKGLRSALRFEAVLPIRHPKAEWGNSHLAPRHGAASPNPRGCACNTRRLRMRMRTSLTSHLLSRPFPLPPPPLSLSAFPLFPPFTLIIPIFLFFGGCGTEFFERSGLPLGNSFPLPVPGHVFSEGSKPEGGPYPGTHHSLPHSPVNFFVFGILQK
jgi:hypothetical protein